MNEVKKEILKITNLATTAAGNGKTKYLTLQT